MNPIEVNKEEMLMFDNSDPEGVYGSPLVETRIGDEYQAEIPPLLTQSELSTYPNVSESNTDTALSSFLIGQPVQVTWISKEENALCERLSYENEKVDLDTNILVPGLSPETWSDFEIKIFTLGLYIFGKDLYQVQRFMESKTVGEILYFYYGRFYKSPSYCKWVGCRGRRSKKCILGSKIFTGCRRQELVSRLLPFLSEESKNLLEEVTDELAEKRTTLEEYVSSLKSMVGIRALVETIGIGKGKEDLTTAVKDNSNSGPRKRVRAPELPPGNAFASHSSEDIIKLLNGDLRQSKTRSNNLFWGAVWPRLLAKGWHSKEDKGIDTAPRSGLIFLKPGIKKLSKRKYLNGLHYFDSISDLLSKVASEPQLLDLPTDEEVGSENSVEQSNGLATKLRKDTESPRYLKPRVVEELMEFTVIDTSSTSRVRELKSLPDEKGRSAIVVSQCQRKKKHPLGDSDINTMETSLEAATGASKEPALKQEDQLNGSLPSDQQVRTIKHKFSRQQKADISTHVGPVTKRRRLTACGSGLDPDQDVHTHTPVSPCDGKSEACAEPQVLIDLNLPHDPMESITNEQPIGQCNAAAKTEAIESSTSGGEISEEVPNACTRRLSTRKRPLTAKAREALENGLLRAKARKKRTPARSLDREAGSPRQVRSDESSYGETGSNGADGPKMGAISCPLSQNNETAWPVNS